MTGAFGKRQVPEGAVTSGAGRGAGEPPAGDVSTLSPMQRWLRLAAMVAAAGLIGFGIILWVAANWDDIDRFGRFAIVGGALGAALLVSLVNAARTPGLILSFLAAGGLLALIGQTYQTGADVWQLFAIWALLGLPWALAARSDALWLVWTVVAFVGITLWQQSQSGPGLMTAGTAATLLAWLVAGGLTAAQSPVSPLRPLLGQTHWSFRLATLLTVSLVAGAGASALFASGNQGIVFWLAVLLLGAGAWALISFAVLDLVLVGAVGLGLVTLALSGLTWFAFRISRDLTFAFLLIGVVGGGLVAWAGSFGLKLARDRGLLKGGGEWPIILMTGIGALLAAIPLAAFLFLTFGSLLRSGASTMMVGAAFLAIAIATVRTTPQTSFLHQLGAIALALGFGLLTFGLHLETKSINTATNGVLALVALGLSLAVGRSWTAGLLGALAAGFGASAFNGLFGTGSRFDSLSTFGRPTGWTLVLVACGAWLAWTSFVADERRSASANEPDSQMPAVDSIVGGATLAGILGLMASAGPTFLLSGAFGSAGLPRHMTAVPDALAWGSLSPLSAILALAGAAVLFARRRELATTLGLGAALIAVLLSAVVPQLGVLVLLVSVALAASHRVVGIGALAAGLWVIGSFYYGLAWPLVEKAALMVSLGVTLAILCWLAGVRRPGFDLGDGHPAPMAMAYGLILAGAAATGAIASQSITANEAILANGRQIFLALAPVDPRSLIQGDYMRLNFAVPREATQRRGRNRRPKPEEYRFAIAAVDDRRVAEVQSLTKELPASITQYQVVLPMHFKAGRWVVATDAWYFKEGSAQKFQRAKYGVFRVTTSGTALLEALADESLEIIK